MTYLWSISNDYPHKLIGLYDRSRSPDRFLFTQGHLIKEILDKIYITLPGISKKNALKYNNIQNSAGLPLVDKKIRTILDDLAEFDVQYFDAVIECKDGIIEDYKIVNITHNVLAIDHQRSIYTFIEDDCTDILGFKHLALMSNCLGAHLIARNREYDPHVLVSQPLFDAFKAQKITGIDLITADEFNAIGHN